MKLRSYKKKKRSYGKVKKTKSIRKKNICKSCQLKFMFGGMFDGYSSTYESYDNLMNQIFNLKNGEEIIVQYDYGNKFDIISYIGKHKIIGNYYVANPKIRLYRPTSYNNLKNAFSKYNNIRILTPNIYL